MYHYIALLWDSSNPQAARSAEELATAFDPEDSSWEQAFASNGMRVYTQRERTAESRTYSLPGGRGVILGRLFPAKLDDITPMWEPTLGERDVARYLETAGRRLTEDYWGAYIALFTSSVTSHSVALRDPSGKIPCYHLRHGGVHVLFSDVSDLSTLPLLPFSLNLRYLAAFISMDSLQIRESALSEITEILAGESFELRESVAQQHAAWDPHAIIAAGDTLTYEQARDELRRVTQACIDAWSSVHRRVLHCLSGGLDSSIILGCLSAASPAPSVVCVNHYLEGAEGDERGYARAASERARVPLIETRWSPDTFVFDAGILSLPRNPKPGFSQCGRLIQLATINREAHRHLADAVWKGQGGDHLFLKVPDVASSTDYLMDRGMGLGWIRAVRDEARLTARPYSSVLRAALSFRRKPRRWLDPQHSSRRAYFVRAEALPPDIDRYLSHPWSLAAEALPPGRQYQIYLLSEVVNRHRPLARREFADEHHPLLSQPIVEHCLRTPAYFHLRGARHRSLARDAFRDCVPAQVLQREDKGETTSLVVESIRRARSFLCELLLDGTLVRERLVERTQIERTLWHGHALIPSQLPPLLACIAAEIWAATWSTRSASAPRPAHCLYGLTPP